MDRREFLCTAAAAWGGLLRGASAEWRTFDVTTRVRIAGSDARSRVWLPAALVVESPFKRHCLIDSIQRLAQPAFSRTVVTALEWL